MRVAAVIPVKRFAAAKQRLAAGLQGAGREELAEEMLGRVLQALGRARRIDRRIVVTGEPRAAALAQESGWEVVADDRDAGHSEAALLGIGAAISDGAECVALLPGDCPLIAAEELDALLDGISGPTVTVIPDRHGTGTNGLVLVPPDAIRPSFGEGSCERHVRLAREAGANPSVRRLETLALDIDTAEDLALWRASI